MLPRSALDRNNRTRLGCYLVCTDNRLKKTDTFNSGASEEPDPDFTQATGAEGGGYRLLRPGNRRFA